MEGNKKCSKCKIEKPHSDFSNQSSSKDKLHPYCKFCNNQKKSNWVKNNRIHISLYEREKYVKDVTYRLACKLRSRLRHALLRQVTNKNSKTEELLGVSFSEFKKYIEFLMTPEMTWESIELDHVRPLSSFDLTNPEQLKEAAHFSNIQPLLKSDNRKKGCKYNNHDLAIHREKVYLYLYYKSF